MDKHEYYEVEVPEGFTPMAQPTKDEDRLSNDKIQIKPLEEEDLHEFVRSPSFGLATVNVPSRSLWKG